jgi:hypothetical protein
MVWEDRGKHNSNGLYCPGLSWKLFSTLLIRSKAPCRRQNNVAGTLLLYSGTTDTPKTIFQIALFQEQGFDSYIADAPPVFIQKMMRFVINPLARPFGLRSYDEKYSAQK